MPGTVVQFRIESDAIAYLRKLGLNPNQLAKEALAGRIRELKVRAMLDHFRKHPMRLADARPVEEILREMRDERDQ